MELQPLRNPPRLWRRERLVQGRRTVRVQSLPRTRYGVVHDHPHHRSLRVSFVHQPTHLMGEVLHGAPLGHRHMTPARQRLTGQEQVADALPPRQQGDTTESAVLVVALLIAFPNARFGLGLQGGDKALGSSDHYRSLGTTPRLDLSEARRRQALPHSIVRLPAESFLLGR